MVLYTYSHCGLPINLLRKCGRLQPSVGTESVSARMIKVGGVDQKAASVSPQALLESPFIIYGLDVAFPYDGRTVYIGVNESAAPFKQEFW